MDDSYQIPTHSDIMGKGCITTLFKNRAVISCGFGDNYMVEILSKETFGNSAVDLKDKFDMGEEVVYKADRRVPPIANRPKFVASYVRRVKLCYVGEATMQRLEKSHGFLFVPPEGQEPMSRRIFFASLAYGDFSAKPVFSQIRNCQAFFRNGDKVSYVAVQEKAPKDNRCDLYCLHFDLILNEHYNSRLNNMDQQLIGIIVQILEPVNDQSRPVYRNCRIYVKKVGFLTLFAEMVHHDVTNLSDIVQLGDRISFRYRAAEPDSRKKIRDVDLMDKNSQLRLKKWLMDNLQLKNNNSSPTPIYKFNDFDNETASYNDRSSYIPSRSTNSFHSQYDFGSECYSELDASHDSVIVHAGSQNTISSQLDSTLSFGRRQPSLKMTGPNYLSQPSVRKMTLPVQESLKTSGGGGFIPRELVKAITPRNYSVSIQTDNSGEDSLLERIMEDEDIFNFIASKQPQIIREWYKSVKKRV